ncbi:alpha-amylase family glycosyl hydrolase [Erwinia amylovora]|uniref:Sucrose phosphorylase n=4 Tax=Erwinia amylovora TaxID=552 RepID=A0A831A2K0_ERWAM|nr:alpha-amylase family glycosyl hydrolase [Erwinia amylovora]CBX82350.1 sucrose phosphorylase [Erwinia amylovora ATCC BAA-2158]CDK16765.1 sucrose phosphorylase [Erwinia amylovora LA635]CDK20133.1 sucrose phosphorylase [Erwinia amylovora LA636]CDK23504.1 sucrose phosphorylase [Erwinia amylovora LA637]ATZ12981.1 sugar phosphorylase [Erwinia amylovora]
MTIIDRLINEIYDSAFPPARLQQLHALVAAARERICQPRKAHWDQQDVVLIAYADQFHEDNTPTLATFSRFYRQHLQSSFNLVHLLPFFPSSSDDGFAVIDYHQVDPPYGSWQDIAELHQHTRLMFDFVCNHMSAHSAWFAHYLAQDPGWDNFFISRPPAADLSAVTRPRTSPLLTPFVMANGEARSVWTTFSADQVDLNYADPDVLLSMVTVLLDYLQQGADYLRLDAVGYLWKTPGTACIHLAKTHLLVKLFRAIIDEVAAGTVLLTETNVPHDDNIRYFGNGRDEAHMVYQFPLPPLVLHAIHHGSSRALRQWASSLDGGSGSTTFFNFLASHDGIGLNPLRGILPEHEIVALAQDLAREGALISWKTNPDGTTSPYEINVTYLDALSKERDDDDSRLQRFLLAHGLLLAFPGVPAVYVQSILGSRNDLDGVKVAGMNRAINRQKYALSDIEKALAATGSLRQRVWYALSQLIQVRIRQAAFHPDNPMTIGDSDDSLLVMQRQTKNAQDTLCCVFNLSAKPVGYRLPEPRWYRDVASGERIDGKEELVLDAWQFRWLQP